MSIYYFHVLGENNSEWTVVVCGKCLSLFWFSRRSIDRWSVSNCYSWSERMDGLKSIFWKIGTKMYRSFKMYGFLKMYRCMSMVHFERSVHCTLGIYTISTRKIKSVHFERSVHFGTDLSKCTDLAKCTFRLIGTFWKIGTFWYQSEKGAILLLLPAVDHVWRPNSTKTAINLFVGTINTQLCRSRSESLSHQPT